MTRVSCHGRPPFPPRATLLFHWHLPMKQHHPTSFPPHHYHHNHWIVWGYLTNNRLAHSDDPDHHLQNKVNPLDHPLCKTAYWTVLFATGWPTKMMRIICKIDLRHWTILVAIGRPTQIIVIISKSNYCTAPSSLQQTGLSRFFVSFVMFVDVCAVQILKLVPGWAGYWYLFVWFVFRVFGFITEYWTLLFVCFELMCGILDLVARWAGCC